jgi:hypothetical protein
MQFRDDSPPPASTSAPKPKGKRVMDSFLEDLKRCVASLRRSRRGARLTLLRLSDDARC